METFVVAFDVSNNKIRRRINKILASWGDRVQKSVYEIKILPNEVSKVTEKLKALLEPGDSLRFYAQTQQQNPLCLGKMEVNFQLEKVIVI